MRGNKFTDSWRSLKACQDGIKAMRADERNATQSKARRCFESALHHDSANWIARFYLALSFCGEDVGKPAVVLRHFHMLDEVLKLAADEQGFQDLADLKLAQMRGQRVLGFIRKPCRHQVIYRKNAQP